MMRVLVAIWAALAAGIFFAVGAAGLSGSWVVATLAGGAVAGGVAAGMWRYPIRGLEPSAASRGLLIVALLGTIVSLVQLSRVAIFMVDASRVRCSLMPSSEFEIRHSCASAYFVAAHAVEHGPNVYDDALYSLPQADLTARRQPRVIGPFRVDVYEYPPPFLLLPRALDVVTADFMRFRAVWFGLNGASALLAVLLTAGALGARARTRALLLSPLLFAALPMLGVLQKGNVQILIVAWSMLAMLSFDRGRPLLGAALLSFAIVSKLYPSLLLVYLFARRDHSAIAWTVAFSAGFVLASILDTGWGPLAAFVAHLPGLLGGESFPAFRNPAAIAINYSVPGMVFKLGFFGVPGPFFAASKVVGWIYTAAAGAATYLVARRPSAGDAGAPVWLAILILATLRSPFLPQAYAGFPPIWLLILVAATAAPTGRTLAFTVLAWLGLNVVVPMDRPLDPRWTSVILLVPQALSVALAVGALVRSGRGRRAADQAA